VTFCKRSAAGANIPTGDPHFYFAWGCFRYFGGEQVGAEKQKRDAIGLIVIALQEFRRT